MINEKECIYFFITSLSGGGAEAVCVNIANALAREGFDVRIVVLNEKSAVYKTEIGKSVSYENLNVKKMRFSFFKLFLWVLKNKPKRIIVFNYEMSVLMVLVRFFTFDKFFIYSRNINNFEKKYKNRGIKGKLVKLMISVFYGKSDFVINQCNKMQEQFEIKFPELIKRNAVIYNSINRKFDFDYTFIKSLSDNNDTTPYFLCVGRFGYQKNFHHALESFALFLKECPLYKLIFIGEGELKDNLIEYANFLNISDSVEFKGFTRDLSGLYVNASATLLTSHFEGFPNVLVESIAHGTPVISVDCESGPSEIIEDGVNGYLVKSLSAVDFSKKMVELVRHSRLDPYQIYQSSRRFSIDKIVHDWINIL